MKPLNINLLKKNIEETINADIKSDRVGGAVVIVKQDGKTVYKNAFGSSTADGKTPMQENTIFRLASLTKPITAVAAIILAERGEIHLDDPIEKYLPEFGDRFIAEITSGGELINRRKALNKITIKNILTHTSGIGSRDTGSYQSGNMTEDDKRTVSSCVAFFAKQSLEFEPGTKESYSAFAAFDVLVEIIEKISGEDYNTFLKKNLFIPCDMRDTTFVLDEEQNSRLVAMHESPGRENIPNMIREGCIFENFPSTHYLGGAGLVSTVNDYANFAEMLLCGGVFGGKRIISENGVKLISTPHVPEEIQPGSQRWGLGVRVITGENTLPVGSYGWSGAYGGHFWVDPVNKITAVYMKNSRHDGGAGAQTAVMFEKNVYDSIK